MITSYVDAYNLIDPKDPYSEITYDQEGFKVNFVYEFTNFTYLHQASSIEKNRDKFVKPFRTPAFSGHFVFSHGHLVPNAGYVDYIGNAFLCEEPM